MQGLLGLIVFVLDIIAILDCIKTMKETGKKALWIALIVILPVIGLILYYVIGKKK
ncbi:MAG TPA: PLD nuclease N-terminal domain-containing protein [Candidatus Omnitrophota bacterium]|nr:PLD nuclease N-terminal domain-containing protein [Candidatus Omnitrophota bacterium]HPN88005.1 PLD nuclease N-terminal domain-containing protein [Candidatus Omnitrophota bacterium]